MKCSPCLPKIIRERIASIEYKDAHPDSVIGRHLYYDAIRSAYNDANVAITIRNGRAICSTHLLREIGLYKE